MRRTPPGFESHDGTKEMKKQKSIRIIGSRRVRITRVRRAQCAEIDVHDISCSGLPSFPPFPSVSIYGIRDCTCSHRGRISQHMYDPSAIDDHARRGDRQPVAPFAGEYLRTPKNASGNPTLRELWWHGAAERHDRKTLFARLEANVGSIEVKSQRGVESQRRIPSNDQHQLVERRDSGRSSGPSRSTRPRSMTQPMRSAASGWMGSPA